MEYIEIKKSELKQITLFLIENKIVFHPKKSPIGVQDFVSCNNIKCAIFLNRKILVKIMRLLVNGELKDAFSLKLIGSLLLWSE